MKDMKKVIFTLIVVLFSITILTAQNKAVCELFLNKFIPEYDSLLKIMDQTGLDFIAYHFNSQDTLRNPDVMLRMNHMYVGNIPSVFVNGYLLGDNQLLRWQSYDSIAKLTTYSNNLTTEAKLIRIQYVSPPIGIISVKVNLSGLATGQKVTAMITETFPGTKYKNIMRMIICEDSVYTGNEILKSVQAKSNWKLENCKVLVMVENENHKVIDSDHVVIKSQFTGIEEIQLRIVVYPNPVKSTLTIESNEPLSVIRIINSIGMILENRIVNDYQYQYQMSNLPDGLYFIQTPAKTFRIVKQ